MKRHLARNDDDEKKKQVVFLTTQCTRIGEADKRTQTTKVREDWVRFLDASRQALTLRVGSVRMLYNSSLDF